MANWTREVKKLIRRMVKAILAEDVHTHLPALVVSYNSLTNTAVIQPCINKIYMEDPISALLTSTKPLPMIEDVPVQQISMGSCLLTVAPTAGTYGVYHVSERSIERWLLAGGVNDPTSGRTFDLSDGFFSPGIFPLVGIPAGAIQTDRISLRTLAGTTEISVLANESIAIQNAIGSVTIGTTGGILIENAVAAVELAVAGGITIDNAAGSIEMSAAGTISVNGTALTVTP